MQLTDDWLTTLVSGRTGAGLPASNSRSLAHVGPCCPNQDAQKDTRADIRLREGADGKVWRAYSVPMTL